MTRLLPLLALLGVFLFSGCVVHTHSPPRRTTTVRTTRSRPATVRVRHSQPRHQTTTVRTRRGNGRSTTRVRVR
ncbi:MAG: hypothetical protein H6721_20095 [Sandaracinus sp.]|nr:hypothetical protein [Sandaracinus sp.]MCB9617188.1 hypothetical protein [Sandaracinus sp.]MCB9634430.1 hypothetical protein [Sandaracinus sp.]